MAVLCDIGLARETGPNSVMAADFIMPRLPDQHQHRQSPFYAQQRSQPYPLQKQSTFPQVPIPTPFPPPAQNTNPQISPLSTSGNGSPSSPKNYLGRPIRPMYMPAVLRPTEFPSKAPPVRPKYEDDDAEERTLRPNNSFISLGGLGALGRLSRRSTGDSGKCVDGKWDLDMFPQPTGTPTRKHWKVRAAVFFLRLWWAYARLGLSCSRFAVIAFTNYKIARPRVHRLRSRDMQAEL